MLTVSRFFRHRPTLNSTGPAEEQKSQIVIFHPEGNLNQNPTLLNLVKSLTHSGASVTIVTSSPIVHDVSLPGLRTVSRGKFMRLVLILVSSYLGVPFFLRFFYWSLHTVAPLERASVVIGVDREGIIEAHQFARRIHATIHLFSFEIMSQDETSASFKAPERLACRYIARAFVQDPTRAALLSVENEIDSSKISLIPVAPKGLGSQKLPSMRDKLGIPRDMKVAVMMGSIASWSGVPEILASLPFWPDGWALILHSRDSIARDQPDGAPGGSPDRLFLSKTPFRAPEDLGFLLGGVDLGLAFYIPSRGSRIVGTNIEKMGLASGKISTYLSFGIPVVSNAGFGYDTLLPENSAGAYAAHPRDLPEVLARHDFSAMKESARRLFTEKLDYGLYESELIALIFGGNQP